MYCDLRSLLFLPKPRKCISGCIARAHTGCLIQTTVSIHPTTFQSTGRSSTTHCTPTPFGLCRARKTQHSIQFIVVKEIIKTPHHTVTVDRRKHKNGTTQWDVYNPNKKLHTSLLTCKKDHRRRVNNCTLGSWIFGSLYWFHSTIDWWSLRHAIPWPPLNLCWRWA